jgi:hypothetical protein
VSRLPNGFGLLGACAASVAGGPLGRQWVMPLRLQRGDEAGHGAQTVLTERMRLEGTGRCGPAQHPSTAMPTAAELIVLHTVQDTGASALPAPA